LDFPRQGENGPDELLKISWTKSRVVWVQREAAQISNFVVAAIAAGWLKCFSEIQMNLQKNVYWTAAVPAMNGFGATKNKR
jgi:hypothetical protein